jgi:HEPN domain-containing protein/transposase-like protein
MTKNQKEKKNVTLDLLQNSDSFTEEAMRNAIEAEHDPRRWKFAILHMVQAIELCLKAILQEEHAALIYDDIDKPKHTVGIQTAIGRIQRYIKKRLSAQDIKALLEVARIRNAIVHSTVDYDPVQMKLCFAQQCGFLRDLFRKFFNGEHLADYVDKKLWKELLKIEAHLQEMRNRAMDEIEADPNLSVLQDTDCPICASPTVVFPDPKSVAVKCFCCGFEDEIWQCEECGRDFFESVEEPAEESSWGHPCCERCCENRMDYGDYLYHLRKDGGDA